MFIGHNVQCTCMVTSDVVLFTIPLHMNCVLLKLICIKINRPLELRVMVSEKLYLTHVTKSHSDAVGFLIYFLWILIWNNS